MDDFVRHVTGFVLGILVENAGEWTVHKYILHGLGRKPGSLWHDHWRDHHVAARRNGMVDPGYGGGPLRWNTQGKELALMLLAILFHLPVLPVAPGYVLGMYGSLAAYYVLHRRAHRDPLWARRCLRWHYDHHMGANPDANWCTSWPGFDWVMGTRIKGPGR